MAYAEHEGHRIHYRTEGRGVPLVLHHWSFASLEGWYDYGWVRAMADEYRLVLLDARGHGKSDKPHDPGEYSLESRVGDVVAVLDDLGIAKAHFFGYSMGGWIGFGAGRFAPERFLSLIIGGQHPYAQSLQELRDALRVAIEQGPEAFIRLWETGPGDLSPAQKDRIRAYDFEALMALAQDRESLEASLPSMDLPCMLIAGETDEARPAAREAAGHMPNATVVTVPGMGHIEGVRRSDLIAPHLKRFLEGVPGPPEG